MGEATDSEKTVLESLKRERDELNGLIEALEKRISLRLGGTVGSSNTSGKVGPDDFFRMTTPDAIKKFLKTVGKPARSTTDMIDGLKSGGLATNYTNVYTALSRLEKKGEVVKVGDNWGLEAWYPPAPAREPKPALADLSTEELVEEAEKFVGKEGGEEQQKTEAVEVAATNSGGTKGDGRKKEIADFINLHGPSTRAEILAGTDVPEGTFAYCMKDKERFVKGEDGKWRNVE